jgi:biotin carboxyl carrier protein
MKMEYRLAAPKAGHVETVNCAVDELVDLGQVLVSLGETET